MAAGPCHRRTAKEDCAGSQVGVMQVYSWKSWLAAQASGRRQRQSATTRSCGAPGCGHALLWLHSLSTGVWKWRPVMCQSRDVQVHSRAGLAIGEPSSVPSSNRRKGWIKTHKLLWGSWLPACTSLATVSCHVLVHLGGGQWQAFGHWHAAYTWKD